MIELLHNQLKFRFPGVHPEAECAINFQRTLRIPDDNQEYPLPPGLGHFPIEHVDDFADRLPETWHQHGGVFIPMYQSEALWIEFSGDYPCAVKIAAGKINAISGKEWTNGLTTRPQDYAVIPEQPWLDGFNVAKGYIRQFVAMPLGEGFTAEEQLAGEAEHGGIQIIAYPMKRDIYSKLFERRFEQRSDMVVRYSMAHSGPSPSLDMGLAAGGLMRQKIYEDEYGIKAWDQENGFRCFVHLANSALYRAVTGHAPPHKPPTAKDYTRVGLPWYDHYADKKSLHGAAPLSGLTSVGAEMIAQGKGPLADNDPVQPKIVCVLKRGSDNMVRDGKF